MVIAQQGPAFNAVDSDLRPFAQRGQAGHVHELAGPREHTI
jgi:hypothetical protein